MTAIPDATEEDFRNLQKLEAWHSACVVRISGKVVADSWQDSLGSAVRLLSHYQRENERLARQMDVLAMEFVRTHPREDVQNWENRYQSGDRSDYAIRMHNVFDAITGVGGGV